MKRVSIHSLVFFSSAMMLLLSACGAYESEAATPSALGEATSSHTGASPAVHMELKQNGEVICKVYGTPASTPPTVTDCPDGSYVEQLFDENWTQIGKNKNVVVGPVTAPDPGTQPNAGEAPLRNPNLAFYRYENGTSFENISSNGLDFSRLSVPDSGYEEIKTEGDGSGWRKGAGNFRVSCQYSHFSYDDPILKPGQIDGAHLHMFFGKTNTDYNTNEENIVDSGGGTCNGFALNRSAYWTPALLDDRGKAVIPKQIIVYYKSTRVDDFDVDRMPQGLELLGGNIKGSGDWLNKNPFDVFWSCGGNGAEGSSGQNGPSRKNETRSDTLTELDGKCRNDEPVNATIYFPQCVARENPDIERNENNIKLSDDDGDNNGFSHTFRLNSVADECPDAYPVRIPELAILLYYPPQTSLEGWKLDSDMGATPGSTLHADWIGGWQDETMDLWVENCNRAKKNCTFGQTGTPDRLKRAYNKESTYSDHREICKVDNDCNNDDWLGPYFVTKPEKRR